MTTRYLALIRGINVGGNSLIKMSELKIALEQDGFKNVLTYIQSGNIFFDAESSDVDGLSAKMAASIAGHFGISAGVVVFSEPAWRHIIRQAPKWWGQDQRWKHNLLVLLRPYDMRQVVAAVGALKPDIEVMEPGEGVLYQSMSLELFGRTTTGKLAGSPVYKHMTVRNYNTANKLLELFDKR